MPFACPRSSNTLRRASLSAGLRSFFLRTYRLIAPRVEVIIASKAAVHYRNSPKGMQMCHMCKFYIAGGGRRGGMGGMCMGRGSMMGMMGAGACQVVEGRISPMGYCDLYAPA